MEKIQTRGTFFISFIGAITAGCYEVVMLYGG